MECKKCGYRTTYIEDMAKHYRKKHPNSMRKKQTKRTIGKIKLNLAVERGFTKMERAIMKKLLRKLEKSL